MHFLRGLRTQCLLQDRACSGGCQSQTKAVDGDWDLTDQSLLLSPCGAESLHKPIFLPSQTRFCSPLCGFEGRMKMHKVILTTALSKREPRKSHGEKGFLLQTWGWVAVGQQPLPQHLLHLTHSLFSPSRLPFSTCGTQHCLLSHIKKNRQGNKMHL